MSDDFITQLNASRFMAQRAIDAQTIQVDPPKMVALPGALTPINVDRLEAHQEDGLDMHQIVAYENEQFLKTNIAVREKHAHWVRRDYDAQVQVHREIEAQRRAQEAEASATYQQRLAQILAQKDSEDA